MLTSSSSGINAALERISKGFGKQQFYCGLGNLDREIEESSTIRRGYGLLVVVGHFLWDAEFFWNPIKEYRKYCLDAFISFHLLC